MITAQRQGSVPLQRLPDTSPSHRRPEQHGLPDEHAWPPAEQVEPGWQLPCVVPAGISHLRPWQQSAAAVHAPFCGWHSEGALHTPPVQMPEQHCEGELHDVSFGLQTGPASGVPASLPPVPPSMPPPGVPPGFWHA